LDRILNTGLFDFEKASLAPAWLQDMRGTHTPETEEYGISSFVYRARRPFHPARFYDLIHQNWPGVVRSKGYFWLASDPTKAGNWSQAGAAARHAPAGHWWVSVPTENWPTDEESIAWIYEKWDDKVGDARQELVLIGMDMDEEALRLSLDNCLLTKEEFSQGEKVWKTWANPFIEWV